LAANRRGNGAAFSRFSAHPAIVLAALKTSDPVLLRISNAVLWVICQFTGPATGVTLRRPTFYSLPRRQCYARQEVDRPASRHAGLHSRFHVPSVQHGCAAMLKPMIDIPLASLRCPQRLYPDDPKRLTRSRRHSAVGETRKIAAIFGVRRRRRAGGACAGLTSAFITAGSEWRAF
jgi:hypothetical protein